MFSLKKKIIMYLTQAESRSSYNALFAQAKILLTNEVKTLCKSWKSTFVSSIGEESRESRTMQWCTRHGSPMKFRIPSKFNYLPTTIVNCNKRQKVLRISCPVYSSLLWFPKEKEIVGPIVLKRAFSVRHAEGHRVLHDDCFRFREEEKAGSCIEMRNSTQAQCNIWKS